MTNWVHYSRSSDQIVMYDCEQEDKNSWKPIGLWVTPFGMKDNWYEWCTGEDFRTGNLNYVHDVALSESANILHITSVEALDAFSEQYAVDLLSGETFEGKRLECWAHCHWDKLAKIYDGIMIYPYFWERRLMRGGKTDWYYSWDCASGCIWKASAIESITLRSNVSAGFVSRELPKIFLGNEKIA